MTEEGLAQIVVMWADLDAELTQRGMDGSNGIRMIVADWLKRERRR